MKRAAKLDEMAKATTDSRLKHDLKDIARQWRDLAWQSAELDSPKPDASTAAPAGSPISATVKMG